MFDYFTVIDGYERGAQVYTDTWAQPHSWLAKVRDQVERTTPTGSVLDVGCGGGAESQYWHARGYDVIGIDASPRMIEIARQRSNGIHFEVLNLFDVGRLCARFDIVWCAHILLHILDKDIPAALRGLYDVTNAGGQIMISTPIAELPFEDVSEIAGLVDDLGQPIAMPRTILTVNRLTGVLEAAGYRVESVETASPLAGKVGIANVVGIRSE